VASTRIAEEKPKIMVKNRGLRRSITDFRRHPWLHFISVTTITVALVILGTFFLCYRNFENLAEKTSPQVTGTNLSQRRHYARPSFGPARARRDAK